MKLVCSFETLSILAQTWDRKSGCRRIAEMTSDMLRLKSFDRSSSTALLFSSNNYLGNMSTSLLSTLRCDDKSGKVTSSALEN